MRFFAPILMVSFFLFNSSPLFAAEISFSGSPSIIHKDQEITLDVTLTGAAKNTTNYIRAAFFQSESPTSYFGFVFNHNGQWYNGTPSPIDPKQYLEVSINDNGNWSGQMKVKSDTNSPYFKGNGLYMLKVGRYTASATSVSNWSNAVQIEIQGVDPTPTPTVKPPPTEKPAPTPKPIKSFSSQSLTTIAEQIFPTSNSDLSSYDLEGLEEKEESGNNEVLSLSSENSSPTSSPTPDIKIAGQTKNSSIFIVIGAMTLIGGCGILLVRAYRKQQIEDL